MLRKIDDKLRLAACCGNSVKGKYAHKVYQEYETNLRLTHQVYKEREWTNINTQTNTHTLTNVMLGRERRPQREC